MPWLSIALEVDEGQAEAVSESLLEAGADSVALEDAAAGTDRETARYAEPGEAAAGAWARTRVVALAREGVDPAALVMRAARASAISPLPPFAVARFADDDWVRRTQSQFRPIRAAERLWIVPSWCETPQADAINLRIDPGLAFGTGGHPSTRLVLEWLAGALRGGERVLDYGCGSGILAIAAMKLGAGEAAAVDSDAQALIAATRNARANDVALRVAAPDALPAGVYDLVVANILAGPLIALAPALASRTRAGGRIALSGVLAGQADEVIEAYRAAFDVAVVGSEDGWVLLEGRRGAAAGAP